MTGFNSNSAANHSETLTTRFFADYSFDSMDDILRLWIGRSVSHEDSETESADDRLIEFDMYSRLRDFLCRLNQLQG